jgi:hypothetical protein
MERSDFEALNLISGENISLLDIKGNTVYGTYINHIDPKIPSFNFIEKGTIHEQIIYLADLVKIFKDDQL